MTTPVGDDIAARSRPAQAAWLIVCAAVVLTSLVETGWAVTAGRRVATDGEWREAATWVRAGFRAGDLIVFAPAWSDQVGRSFLGDLVPVDMAARADADHYARIWEVTIRGARAPETRAAGVRLLGERRFGHVHAALWDRGPASPAGYDFTARLPEARVVQSVGGSSERPCYHDGNGFRCAGTRVEKRVMEIDYQPRAGVLVPVDAALTTVLEFDAVPMGRSLVVYTGMHDYFARKNGGGPTTLSVEIDREPHAVPPATNESGWRRTVIDTSALDGTSHRVRFLIASHQPAWRNFALHAETRAEAAK